jgi:hypothetical protein
MKAHRGPTGRLFEGSRAATQLCSTFLSSTPDATLAVAGGLHHTEPHHAGFQYTADEDLPLLDFSVSGSGPTFHVHAPYTHVRQNHARGKTPLATALAPLK